MTPLQSFPSIPVFCTAGNKVALDSSTLSIGYQPQQQLPCEYYNQVEYQETTALNTVFSGLNNITAELDLIVTSGGASPSMLQTNQVLNALNVLYQAHANGSKWALALSTLLGTNWATAFASNLDSSWLTPLANLGTYWSGALAANLGVNWQPALAAQGPRTCLSTSFAGTTLTVTSDYEYYLTGASTVTLPASPVQGQRLTFRAKTTATSIISANGGQTIGPGSAPAYTLLAASDYVTLEWDGSSVWIPIAYNTRGQLAKTANFDMSGYNILGCDYYVDMDATGGNCTLTLPTHASIVPGWEITVRKIDTGTNTVTVQTSGGDQIGTTSSTSFVLYSPNDYVTLLGKANGWAVVATNGPLQTSIQTGQVTCSIASQWNAMGNGLALNGGSAISPGVYDIELSVNASITSGLNGIEVAIGNATTPISEVSLQNYNNVSPVYGPMTKVTLKGYVLSSAAVIQGIYYFGNASGTAALAYSASSPNLSIGRITARRIG